MTLDSLEGEFTKAKARSRGRRFFQVNVAWLMALVAVVAVLCFACVYHREYAGIERAWVSLARVGPWAGIDWGPIKGAAENDPAIEVRTAAFGALCTGWPEQVRNQDVLGR